MSDPRWKIAVTTTCGQKLIWHKGGREHTLSYELGPTWVQNFKPQLFQIAADGSFVPRGSMATAMDVANVELIEVPAE